MTGLRGRDLRMQTLQRYAEWTGPEWSGFMFRSTGLRLQQGPLVALELGDRAADAVLNPPRLLNVA